MSNLKTLLESGAKLVAGNLVHAGQVLARHRNGDAVLTDAGRERLQELAREALKPRGKTAAAPSSATGATAQPVKPARAQPAQQAQPAQPAQQAQPTQGDLLDQINAPTGPA
jgi:hypothetical protein